jgi:DtxR family Mn-dependent transcriptional regulator
MREDLSQTEENYLKTIYQLPDDGNPYVTTNQIAGRHATSAASVTDMIKRLAEKNLIDYEKYKGVRLTPEGDRVAKALIRKHRLWEYFLVEKLSFEWDEVHTIAEQLEHIKSTALTDRLDGFLGHPRYDPHGDPIPDKEGRYAHRSDFVLQDFQPEQEGIVVGVKNSDTKFLQLLESTDLVLGAKVRVLKFFEFDHSLSLLVNDETETHISYEASCNLYVKPL